jgi:hypothetical protein
MTERHVAVSMPAAQAEVHGCRRQRVKVFERALLSFSFCQKGKYCIKKAILSPSGDQQDFSLVIVSRQGRIALPRPHRLRKTGKELSAQAQSARQAFWSLQLTDALDTQFCRIMGLLHLNILKYDLYTSFLKRSSEQQDHEAKDSRSYLPSTWTVSQ